MKNNYNQSQTTIFKNFTTISKNVSRNTTLCGKVTTIINNRQLFLKILQQLLKIVQIKQKTLYMYSTVQYITYCHTVRYMYIRIFIDDVADNL
jgi:hypothetical protein